MAECGVPESATAALLEVQGIVHRWGPSVLNGKEVEGHEQGRLAWERFW